jgi:transcriptional regulator with XRE-family HTH domain
MNSNIENNVYSTIGTNIKTARILKNMTQEQLAEKLKKSTNFVSLIERGQSGISVNTIIDICNILDIDPNAIFNGLVEYNNEQDKLIINSISSLSSDDKDIISELIEYINNKNTK